MNGCKYPGTPEQERAMAVNNEEYMEMQDLYQAEKRKNERLREALSELVEALKILGSDTYILSEKTRISIAKSALSNYQKYMESELCQ